MFCLSFFFSLITGRILFDAGVFRNVPGDGILVAAVSDLADARREVSMVSEMLRKENDISKISPRGRVVIEDGGDVRSAAAEQRSARRIAEGILAIRAVEANTARCQAIDVGRVYDGVAITADAIVEVVGGDEQDIQFARSRGGGESGKRRGEGKRKQITSGEQGGHCLRIHGVSLRNKATRELRNRAQNAKLIESSAPRP
jgi:hypothetical protein